MKPLFLFPVLIFFIACTGSNEAIVKTDSLPTGLTPVKEYGKWGYINSKGQKIINCQFDWAGGFYEGLAVIERDSLYGFIDETGEIVIEPKYTYAENFSDGLAKVVVKEELITPNGPALEEPYLKKTFGFIKRDGALAFISPYSDVNSFSYGRAGVKINDSACFLNKRGEVVIKTEGYYYIWLKFQEGIALVGNDSASWYIDTLGKEIGRFDAWSCDDFSNGFAKVISGKKVSYIDKTFKHRILPEMENIEFVYSDFSDGLAHVYFLDKSGYIDTTGKLVIPFSPGYFGDFKEGLVQYEDDGHWGFMNKEGKVAIKAQFDRVCSFSNGLSWAKRNETEGYIDYKGEFVWTMQKDIEYEKLDLSKWELDTLSTNMPLYDIAGDMSDARKGDFTNVNELTLKVDTAELTVFDDEYYAYKLYFINGSAKTEIFRSLSNKIEIVCQAVNEQGKWEDIEKRISSFCGNSYDEVGFKPGHYRVFAVPFFKGKFKTKFRFRLNTEKGDIYSNVYEGYISTGQFVSSAKANSN